MFSSTFKNEVINLLESIINTLAAIQGSLKTLATTLSGVTKSLNTITTTLATNQGITMAAIDDLNASIAALEAEEVQILADIKTLLTEAGTPDEAVEAAKARIDVVTGALVAGDPVPPVAPPAPSA